MFFLSLCLGGLGLVMVHHLFDASWSVPIRRFCEHMAWLLFPWMAVLFIPIAVLAPQDVSVDANAAGRTPRTIRSMAKYPLFTMPGFTSSRWFALRSGGCCRTGCVTGR